MLLAQIDEFPLHHVRHPIIHCEERQWHHLFDLPNPAAPGISHPPYHHGYGKNWYVHGAGLGIKCKMGQ